MSTLSDRIQRFFERHAAWRNLEVVQQPGTTLCLVVTARTNVRVTATSAVDGLNVFTHHKLGSANSRGIFTDKNTSTCTIVTGSSEATQAELAAFQRQPRYGTQLVLFTDYDENDVPEVSYQSVQETVLTESADTVAIECDIPLVSVEADVPYGTKVIVKVVAEANAMSDKPSTD
jgi:hypothetical protein